MTREQVLSAALQLDPADRETLAEELFQSVSGADSEAIDAAWLDEIRRRDAEFQAGLTSAQSVHEVLERLQAKVRS